MKENDTQNRFIAYLAAAVRNRKMNYYEDKMKSREIEFSSMDLLEKNHTDFNKEFHNYILEQTLEAYEKAEVLEEILNIVGDRALTTVVEQLKHREKQLLYGRVFGGLEFEELAAGDRGGQKGRQIFGKTKGFLSRELGRVLWTLEERYNQSNRGYEADGTEKGQFLSAGEKI